MIILATIPVLVVGFLTHDWIEANLESPRIIGYALLIGGVAMIVIEVIPTNVTTRRIERVTWKQALGIGFAQILAAVFPGHDPLGGDDHGRHGRRPLPPGGGGVQLLPRHPRDVRRVRLLAAEVGQESPVRRPHEVLLLIIGTLVSFLVAYAVIAVFMGYIRRHKFIPFAIYRIVLGVIVLFVMR